MMIDTPQLRNDIAQSARPLLSSLILMTLVVLVSCRDSNVVDSSTDARSPVVDAPDGTVSIPPDRTSNPLPSKAQTTAIEASPKLFETTQLSAGDAAAEGWSGEAFTERANAQLKHVVEWIIDPSEQNIAQLFSDSLQATPLVPNLKVVLTNGEIQVQRSTEVDPPPPVLIAPSAVVQPLRTWLSGSSVSHGKFKLFRVTPDGDAVVTKQFFHLDGKTSDQAFEHNSLWTIRWDVTTPESPRIAAIKVSDVEQVNVQVDQQARFGLADCTASLLNGSAAYETCLVAGIPELWERVESNRGVYHNGQHGIAVGDANGDGLDDVYICQTGGLPNHLFLQKDDGLCQDVSRQSGADFLDNTRSALFVDLDNDGDQDLIVALASGLVFLENDGAAVFRQRARIASLRQAFSLAAADYDNDRRVDLFVCSYYGTGQEVSELPLPLPYFNATNGGANVLIRNVGNWRFEDATKPSGLDVQNSRFSFAASWEDEDNDGDVDLYIVNDFGPNQLFRNEAGRFVERTDDVGLVDGAFGMSATFGDFNRDGAFDIYISNMFSAAGNRVTFDPRFKPNQSAATIERFRYLARGNTLFRNKGDGTYEDVSELARVAMGRWSWGSLFGDLNNDGWEDLLVANGYITGEQTDDL